MKLTEDIIESRFQLGLHVKELRTEMSLTQRQFGSMVGLDRSYISRVECGRCNVTFDNMLLIANGLGVTPSELLNGVSLSLSLDDESMPIGIGLPR